MTLMEYQNKRGGRVVLQTIAKPDANDWTAIDALKASLDLEKSIHNALIELHGTAEEHKDGHLTDFVESKFLEEQVSAEFELATLISKLERAGPDGLGLHMIDGELLREN